MNKKGLSAIAFTGIVIIFAISFGLVMKYVSAGASTQGPSCKVNVGLSFTTISDEKQLCFDGENIQFTIENGAETKILGLEVTLNEETKIDLPDLDIGKVASYVGNVPFSSKPKKVSITPKIKINDVVQSCESKSLNSDDIRDC